jgi:hypothetical protein
VTDKPNLSLVPPTPPDAKAALAERVKASDRPDGMLQCSRCGGRQTLTIRSGDTIKAGRIIPGTVIEKGICPHCWKQGITVDMIPPMPRIVKEPKLRRTKPKPVK